MSEMDNSYHIEALDRGLALIEEMSKSADPMNLTEAAAALDATENATFRILKTLEARKWIRPVEGGYEIGETTALPWKAFRINIKARIERDKKYLKDTAIMGEDDEQ